MRKKIRPAGGTMDPIESFKRRRALGQFFSKLVVTTKVRECVFVPKAKAR